MTKVFRASLVGAALFGIVLVTFIALPGTAAAQTRCDYCDEGFGPGEWDYCVLTVQDEACEAGSQPSPF